MLGCPSRRLISPRLQHREGMSCAAKTDKMFGCTVLVVETQFPFCQVVPALETTRARERREDTVSFWIS